MCLNFMRLEDTDMRFMNYPPEESGFLFRRPNPGEAYQISTGARLSCSGSFCPTATDCTFRLLGSHTTDATHRKREKKNASFQNVFREGWRNARPQPKSWGLLAHAADEPRKIRSATFHGGIGHYPLESLWLKLAHMGTSPLPGPTPVGISPRSTVEQTYKRCLSEKKAH
jgi:hypothetical protein